MSEKESLLRLSAVQHRTGLSRSSIYAAMKANAFPSSIPIGLTAHPRAVGWLESEINDWIIARIKTSRTE